MTRNAAVLVPFTLFVVVLGIGQGCGKKATEPSGDGPGEGVTATVPPEGLEMVVDAGKGVTVTVTFPPGAVATPTEVTLIPESPADGSWVGVVFEPAGLIFREAVSVLVTAPEDKTLDDQVLYWGQPANPVLLPTVPDTGARTVQTTIRSFGIPGEEFLFPSVAPGGLAPLSSAQTGGGNQMNAQAFTCQQIVAQAQTDFDRLVSQEDYEGAIRSALSSAETLQLTACPEAQDWLQMAADLACTRFQALLDSISATSITGLGQFEKAASRVIYWHTAIQQLQPDCPAASNYLAVLDAEGQDFVNFYRGRLDALSALDGQEWNTLKLEASHIYVMVGEAYSLGASDAANLILTQALQPIYDHMREIAYGMGRNHGWHYVLSRLTQTGFFAGRDILGVPAPRRCDDTYSPPRCLTPSSYGASYSDNDIFDDLQYCRTDLVLETVTAADSVLDFGVAGGGATAGVKKDRITLNCPTRGTLRLNGTLGAMTCFNDIDADNEVIVSFNQVDVLTLRRPPGASDYLGGIPAEIDLAQAAQVSGFVPSEGTQADVAVRRLRTQCDDDMWGPQEFTLLKATLKWKNPTLKVDITFPEEVQSGQPTPVDIRVGVVDQFNTTGYFSDVDVSLSVSGGTAAQTSGVTDAQGTFRTDITAANPVPMSLAAAAASGLFINVTATSFEGVMAQGADSASVLPCDAVEHYFREGGSGTKILEWGHLMASVSAGEGASTEWIDDYTVYPDDTTLNGQKGFVYIKVFYSFKSTGTSDSRPAARVVIGPRNGFSSPFFWERNYNTPGGTTENVEEGEWEIPLSCTFGRSSAPMDVNCDAFSGSTTVATSVSCEVRWMGITKVTLQDGTVVSGYRLCSGSGTDWENPQ